MLSTRCAAVQLDLAALHKRLGSVLVDENADVEGIDPVGDLALTSVAVILFIGSDVHGHGKWQWV